MHEMGIAMRIVEIAAAAIPPGSGEARVESVNLKIGRLTAIVPDSLRFCYNIVARDTPLAGSRLAIEETPISARCRGCGLEFQIEEPPFTCRGCGSGDLDLLSGRELIVTSIELAD